jgi:hypothetical protein
MKFLLGIDKASFNHFNLNEIVEALINNDARLLVVSEEVTTSHVLNVMADWGRMMQLTDDQYNIINNAYQNPERLEQPHEVTVNALELSDELADIMVYHIMSEDMKLPDEQIYVEKNGGVQYTEEAQDLFNEWQERYEALINDLSI